MNCPSLPSMLFWTTWVGLASLLLHRLGRDAQLLRSPACDTTYLWEGYQEVPLGRNKTGYRLFKFADGDVDTVAAFSKLQQRPEAVTVVPVLFVHGHLGSHQQMRSAASETGRELVRRMAGNPPAPPFWPQWYAADFNAEPSALDGTLLGEQASFVVRCIHHLRQVHAPPLPTSTQGQAEQQQLQLQPFRMVLVAYSMGGLVAQQAVQRLAADPSFDMRQLVAVVRLGSPDHFPGFMPHTPMVTLLGSMMRSSSGSGGHADAAALQVPPAALTLPRVNILAGAADFSLPQTHTNVAGQQLKGSTAAELSLLMRDMPGVWATCSHKGIVSCNQLVRQLVPLLADAAMASLGQYSSLAQQQAAVQALLRERLATNTASAIGLEPTAAMRSGSGGVGPQQWQRPACKMEASEAPAEQVTVPLLRRAVPHGQTLRLSWDGNQAAKHGWQGLLLLVTSARPCTQWSTLARHANGSSTQLADSAAALPPLLPDLQQRWVPRHWQEVMAGIDWQQNATRLLFVPFADGPGSQLSSIDVAVHGSKSGTTAILAQALVGHLAQRQAALALAPPGRASTLPVGHAAALWLQLPQHSWPLGSSACANSDQQSSLRCLAQVLVGSTPPWNVRISVQDCSGSSSSSSSRSSSSPSKRQHILPAVVAVQSGSSGTDSIRVASSNGNSSARMVELWNGVAPLDGLLLITDPGCAYSLKLEWDISGWLGLTLRHLLFILPPLCIAASQARLSPLPGSTARVAAAAAVLAALGCQHLEALGAASAGGMQPWVRLSATEALAALLLASGGALAGARLARQGVSMLRRVVPLNPGRWMQLSGRLGGAAAAASSLLLPPFVPACLGCLCLALRLAAAANHLSMKGSRHSSTGASGAASTLIPPLPLAWLSFSSQLALLPAVELTSWLLGGRWQRMAWTDGRLLVAALAVHTCLLRWSDCSTSPGQGWGVAQAARAATHEVAACASAVASLWGTPFVLVYSAALSAAVEAGWA